MNTAATTIVLSRNLSRFVTDRINERDEIVIERCHGRRTDHIRPAMLIANVVGPEGRFELKTSKPDGMPRKCLDSSRLKGLGWQPRVNLADGILRTYEWFLNRSQ
jgi:GDP-L-fucose synthase